MGTYKFYFGDTSMTESAPWELKHVNSFSKRITKSVTAMGIPTKPASFSQIFDMGGPIRTFSISGTRNDWEEEISNYDFIFTEKNNLIGTYDIQGITVTNPTFKGLEWFTSKIQVTNPYMLRVYYQKDNVSDTDPGLILTGKYYVSVTGLKFDFGSENAGMLSYTLGLTQRRS